MPVPAEVANKIKEMRAQAPGNGASRWNQAGRPAAQEAADAKPPVPSEPAQPLATLSTLAARMNQVYHWIIEGATEFDIGEAMQQAWPGADHAGILLAAIEKIRESNEIDPHTVLGFCFEATRDLYRRMVEIGDFPAPASPETASPIRTDKTMSLFAPTPAAETKKAGKKAKGKVEAEPVKLTERERDADPQTRGAGQGQNGRDPALQESPPPQPPRKGRRRLAAIVLPGPVLVRVHRTTDRHDRGHLPDP